VQAKSEVILRDTHLRFFGPEGIHDPNKRRTHNSKTGDENQAIRIFVPLMSRNLEGVQSQSGCAIAPPFPHFTPTNSATCRGQLTPMERLAPPGLNGETTLFGTIHPKPAWGAARRPQATFFLAQIIPVVPGLRYHFR